MKKLKKHERSKEAREENASEDEDEEFELV